LFLELLHLSDDIACGWDSELLRDELVGGVAVRDVLLFEPFSDPFDIFE